MSQVKKWDYLANYPAPDVYPIFMSVEMLRIRVQLHTTLPEEYAVCNSGVITNCSFSGSVRGTGTVGGIAAKCNGKIISCKNTASVSGEEAGGIAGRESSAIPKIYGCYNEGAIDGANAGGILGKK